MTRKNGLMARSTTQAYKATSNDESSEDEASKFFRKMFVPEKNNRSEKFMDNTAEDQIDK